MYEYKRIIDIKESTTDSLEQLCNIEAKAGWRVIQISDGNQFRHATLEREIKDEPRKNREQADIGSGLQTVSVEAPIRDASSATGTPSDKTSTKRQRNTSGAKEPTGD